MSVRMTNFAPVYPFDPATGTPHGTAFSETAQLDKGAHPGQAACKPLTNVLTAGLHIIFVSHHHPRDRGDGRAVAAAQIQAGIADLQAYEYPRGHHQAGRVARTARSGPIFRHDLPQRSRRDESDRLGDPQRGAPSRCPKRSSKSGTSRPIRPPPHRSCSPSPPERTRTSCRSNCSAPMR